MSLDFWNNPLIVSAFRLRYRRGNPTNTLLTYPLLLLTVGMAVPYFSHDRNTQKEWPRIAFFGLMGLQLVISGIMAGSATSAAMKAEVAKQTLDLQRIACLSPRQILLGKLLGRAAGAFFLTLSTIPLGILCWLSGGTSLEVLVLMYCNLVAHALMCGAAGLVTQLEMRDDKTVEGGMLSLLAVPAGFPVFYAFGLHGLDQLLFLAVFPFVQVGLAYLAFHTMERRLENTLHPPFSKPLAYVVLMIVDAAAALALLLDASLNMGQASAAFCLIHVLASFILTLGVTAWRETLWSWVWRFRGRLPWARDCWLGNRTENSLALLTFCGIGVLGQLTWPLLATSTGMSTAPLAEHCHIIVGAAAMSVLLILSFGIIFQWFMLIFGRGGNILIVGFFFLVAFVPWILGEISAHAPTGPYRQLSWLSTLSPGAYFAQWFEHPLKPYNLLPLFALYGPVALLFWTSLRARLKRLEQAIDRKLERMGVSAKPAGGSPPVEGSGLV